MNGRLFVRWDSRSQEIMLPLNSKIVLFIKWVITVGGTSVSNSFESCPMMSYNSVVFYICSKNAWKAVITKNQQLNSSVHCDAVRGEGAITPVRHLPWHPCSNAFFCILLLQRIQPACRLRAGLRPTGTCRPSGHIVDNKFCRYNGVLSPAALHQPRPSKVELGVG